MSANRVVTESVRSRIERELAAELGISVQRASKLTHEVDRRFRYEMARGSGSCLCARCARPNLVLHVA